MAATTPTRQARRPHGPPAIRKLFLVVAGILSILLAGGSAFSIGTIHYAERGIQRVDTGSTCRSKGCLKHVTEQTCTDKPCNFLILGSDSRVGLSKKQQVYFGNGSSVQGHRSDTIIVVHVDPVKNRTVVLSIPRDLLVDIPGYGQNKINSAFEHGPDVLVQTVEKLTGLQINHYVEVNFAGFERLVTALGGVRVCIVKPMVDPLAGLNLPHPGCYTLKGSNALAFVRARHVEGDVIPDFSRISRQQTFMQSLIGKMLSVGAITHLTSIIKAVQHNIVLDSGLNLYALQDLTRKLAALGQGGVDFRVVPAVPTTIGGVDYVEMLPSAKALFDRIREGRYLGRLGKAALYTGPSPAAIRVQVYDAGNSDQANRVFAYLRDAGFAVLPLQPAPSSLHGSQLLYSSTTEDSKGVMTNYLPTLKPRLRPEDVSAARADLVVVIGPDFRGIEP